MFIRPAHSDDADSIRRIHLSAFDEQERDLVSKLAVDLLSEETEPSTVSLIAESNSVAIGHTVFSPVFVHGLPDCIGYILAPIAVHPENQKNGVGSGLIKRGIEILTSKMSGVLLVYGDPEYYGRFGFSREIADRYLPPFSLEYPFGWQGMMLGGIGEPNETVRISCVAPLSKPELW